MIYRFLVSLILLGFSSPTFAYIDPASGSAIMSAVVGLLVAIGLAVKTYWYKLKNFFTPKARKENAKDIASAKDTPSANGEAENGKV